MYRTWFLVLVVEGEVERQEDGSGSGRSSDGWLGGEFLDYVPVISGGTINVASDLVDVAAIGPNGIGNSPNVRALVHFHGENDGIYHLIEEVGVGQVRNRIPVGHISGLKYGVVEVDVLGIH
ncbi:hypothetical protein SLA2020_191520 [Shorea laevis]